MKYILTILTFALIGCEFKDRDQRIQNEGIQIITVDSCEYVWCKNGYGAGLTHKGNCKYCKNRYE